MDWLVNAIYYVIPFAVLLGILVFVHEFGHFMVARWSGVKVEAFSIGFGKVLWNRTDKKGTNWRISAIPLGGYCQFLGDADPTSTTAKDAKELTDEQKKYAFDFQSPIKKLAIAVAGPAANYLFAIVVFASIFFFMGKITYPPVVGEVFADGAAVEAGVKVNDKILSIDGRKIESFDEIRREVELNTDGVVNLKIMRDNKIIPISVKLKTMEMPDANGKMVTRKMLGVKSVSTIEIEHKKMSLLDSIKDATIETWDITTATLRGVGQMISGKRSGEEIGGVIRIAEMSGDISKKNGALDFLVFMALLSVNLGLINLFPIPVLDGGHVVIYLIEIVSRREINAKVKELLFKIGFALILALMIFATWNDFVHLFNRWFA